MSKWKYLAQEKYLAEVWIVIYHKK